LSENHVRREVHEHGEAEGHHQAAGPAQVVSEHQQHAAHQPSNKAVLIVFPMMCPDYGRSQNASRGDVTPPRAALNAPHPV